MNIESLVRKNILNLKPYTSARGSHLSGILLDANENSFGSAIDDVKVKALNRYPDPFHNELREKLSEYLKVNKENICIGVGSDEIIDLLVRIFCEPKIDNAIIPEPTYGMYKVVCDINEINTLNVQLNSSFQPEAETILNKADENSKIIFLCSPNNPTGNLINPEIIYELAKKFKGIIIVDEAYIEFAESHSLIGSINEFPNIVVTRTFSKAWGLAGARCGYAVASKEIIDLLYKIKMPYNINKFTSEAILNALKNSGKKDKFVEEIKKEREYLTQTLSSNAKIKKVYPSESNYILFECEDPKNVYDKLIAKGIVIRDRSAQVKNCLRVSVGTHEENDRFIKELFGVL